MWHDAFISDMTAGHIHIWRVAQSNMTWRIHRKHDSIICDMTHSFIHTFIRDLSLCDTSHSYLTWLFGAVIFNVTQSNVSFIDPFIYTRLVSMRHVSFICDMTHLYLTWLLRAFISDVTQPNVTWRIHTRQASSIYDMTHLLIHLCICDLFLRDRSHAYVTWLIHIWHDCFAHSYLTWLNQIWHDVS